MSPLPDRVLILGLLITLGVCFALVFWSVKRVPELVPEEIAAASGIKLDQSAPIATPDELAEYDAIIFGTPTRFGNMAAPLKHFLDSKPNF